MRTTLVIDDAVMRRLKALAATRGSTLSAVVEEFLRRGLREATGPSTPKKPLRRLPAYDMGPPQVDLSDRAALDHALDRGSSARR